MEIPPQQPADYDSDLRPLTPKELAAEKDVEYTARLDSEQADRQAIDEELQQGAQEAAGEDESQGTPGHGREQASRGADYEFED
jgi:hypothetical protein